MANRLDSNKCETLLVSKVDPKNTLFYDNAFELFSFYIIGYTFGKLINVN